MVNTSNIAWQFERVSFPMNLPVNIFFHRVDSVDFHYHTAFELLLVLSGMISVLTNGQERVLGAGDIALIHSGETHATHDNIGVQNLVLALQIDPAIARYDTDFLRRRFDMDAISGKIEIIQEIWQLAGQIMSETRMKRTAWQMEVEALVLRLVALLVRKIPNTLNDEEQHTLMPDEVSTLNQRLREVAAYIRQHASEDISITDVSKAIGLSSGYLSRLFKIQTGESFGKFITQIRLRKSLELLSAKKPMSMTDIAFECGFPNIKAFNLTFRRFLNCTPGEWCKARLAGEGQHAGRSPANGGYFVPDEAEAMRLLYSMMVSCRRLLPLEAASGR